MFQHSMHTWLHKLSNTWKIAYNIKEEQDVSVQQKIKGSVWLNLQNRAMHNIQQVVRNAMLNVYGEYISCLNHKGKAKQNMTSKHIQCNVFKVF